MSVIAITARRTLSTMLRRFSISLTGALFLAITSIYLTLNLESADGSRQLLIAVIAGSVAPLLPVLSSLLAMDVWSEERRTGNLELLLTAAVRERDLTLGKALGVWLYEIVLILISAIIIFVSLNLFAPSALTGVSLLQLIAAGCALILQLTLWTSIAVMSSAFFSSGAASAAFSLVICAVLPRGLWLALRYWSQLPRLGFGEFPLDAMITDATSGIFSMTALVGFTICSLAALFVASKSINAYRYAGVSGRNGRLSTALTCALALILAALVTAFVWRHERTLELPIGENREFSARTSHILDEASGSISVTCFLARDDREFRPMAQLLRSFGNYATQRGTLRFNVAYVDPRWDLGTASRIATQGVPERSLLITRGYRRVILPVSEGIDERTLASAVRRVALPPQRRDVYWTHGHGELAFDDYSSWGMSDIARELTRDGYRNQSLDLTSETSIPSDCAFIIVANAKEDFSRIELSRLSAYLKRGGRLFVLLSPPGKTGVASILPVWGVRSMVQPWKDAKTLSGSDVIVSDFAEHPIVDQLAGSRIILEQPLAFESSAAATGAQGADRLGFTPLARIGNSAVAAIVERGSGVGNDVAIRPTRIIAIGDGTFVVNAQLANRANANRDFFLNAVAYLSGTETVATGKPSGRLHLEMDRNNRRRFLFITSGAVPFVLLLLLSFAGRRRRSRR